MTKVLEDEDYAVPVFVEKRILQGAFSKDKGTYSSRINQIMRQADKVPGPGKYVAHKEWDVKNGVKDHVIHEGNKFPNGQRDYKPMNKTPAPATYENKNFYLGESIGGSDKLSNRSRVIYGQIPKGKRRSSLDGLIKHSASMPFLNTQITNKSNNKLDLHNKGSLQWSKENVKNATRGKVEIEIGPGHYAPNWDAQEAKQPCHAIPKAKAQNFLDKAVKEKMICLRTKKEVPGPGTYNTHDYDDSKFSRGTKLLQTRGMARCSVSGYF